MRTLDLLASDPSHLPFLFVFKESGVMAKYGYEIDLHIVGGAKAPTMKHRAKLDGNDELAKAVYNGAIPSPYAIKAVEALRKLTD